MLQPDWNPQLTRRLPQKGTSHAGVPKSASAPETAGQPEAKTLHVEGPRWSYFGRLFAERRERPGTDLLTGLVQARDNEERLTETELLILGTALLVAGHETSAHQITNMVHTLLTHPRQLEQPRASPQLIPAPSRRCCATSLAVPDEDLSWLQGSLLRGLTALPLSSEASLASQTST
jgi:cytochrome P450